MNLDLTILAATISVLAAISGISLGWIARARTVKKDTENEAGKDAYIRADMDYIKRGVDDIRLDQRLQGQRIEVLSERVTRVEESSKQAHKRLDRIEREE